MNNKICLILAAIIAAAGVALWAGDSLSDSSGVSRTSLMCRWFFARSATTTTQAGTPTNVVSSVAAILHRIVFVPGSTNDAFTVYNRASGTGIAAANEVFVVTGAGLGNTAGVPINYDVSDLDCTAGITAVLSPGNTQAVMRVFFEYAPTNNRQ